MKKQWAYYASMLNILCIKMTLLPLQSVSYIKSRILCASGLGVSFHSCGYCAPTSPNNRTNVCTQGCALVARVA